VSERSLVTGGAGFIGSHVARHCLELGHGVCVVDDLSGGFAENVPNGADFFEGSVSDAEFVDSLFAREKFDYVYHLAAYAAEGLSHFIRRFNYTNNVIGSVNLLNAAVRQGVQRFVFTSSIAVYGTNQLPMTEELVPLPEDPYGIAKYAVELDLRAAHEMFGLDYTVFRPHNVYGEHQNIGDRYRNVVGIFMNQVMHGLPMTVFGDGSQSRAFSHIDDVAPVIARSALQDQASNEVFNVGADQATTVAELAELVASSFGVDPVIERVPARNEVVHAFASHEKAERLLGAKPTVALDEGIRRMADWARAHGPRQSQRFEGIEVTRNFPAAWASDVATP
jgi:UDP-glucose 4-epimerase